MPSRNKTISVKVGSVGVGGDNPVRVQSMTNTLTADIEATTNQIIELYHSGSELVRFTVKDDEDAKAVPKIRDKLIEKGFGNIPLIGDFHYNGHILLTKYSDCAKTLDKYRINPGNVGFGNLHDKNFKTFIDVAIEHNKPVRIGVNFGSMDQRVVKELKDKYPKKSFDEIQIEAMLISAIESAKKAEEYGLSKDKIIISIKISTVPELIEIYEKLSEKVNYPLHLGLTEAGMGDKGIVASTAALSVLLQKGIGDTIRVSLTPSPNEKRTKEVKVSQLILQMNGVRSFIPTVTSCPGCGRTNSTLFQEISEEVTRYLEEKSEEWRKKYPGSENVKVAVMGCIVNGPGESKDANIGLSLPGTGEDPKSLVYIDGVQTGTMQGVNRAEELKKIIHNYVVEKYG